MTSSALAVREEPAGRSDAVPSPRPGCPAVRGGIARVLVSFLSLCALPACSRTFEGRCRVEGRVTVDGLPAEAELTFYPLDADAGRPVIVVTDADGRFVVDPRNPRNQLPPGRYRIDIRVRSVRPASQASADSPNP
ncbi:MAG: hypothetical protein D6725_16680, partial [Planctomycetota bacterium]